jgi:hypothetical protein
VCPSLLRAPAYTCPGKNVPPLNDAPFWGNLTQQQAVDWVSLTLAPGACEEIDHPVVPAKQAV